MYVKNGSKAWDVYIQIPNADKYVQEQQGS